MCVCYAYGARATARATAKEKREVTLRGGFPVLVHYGGWRCRQEAGLMNRRPACRWEAVLAPQIHCNQQPQKRERETREQKTGPGPRSFRKSDKQRLPRITYVILRRHRGKTAEYVARLVCMPHCLAPRAVQTTIGT